MEFLRNVLFISLILLFDINSLRYAFSTKLTNNEPVVDISELSVNSAYEYVIVNTSHISEINIQNAKDSTLKIVSALPVIYTVFATSDISVLHVLDLSRNVSCNSGILPWSSEIIDVTAVTRNELKIFAVAYQGQIRVFSITIDNNGTTISNECSQMKLIQKIPLNGGKIRQIVMFYAKQMHKNHEEVVLYMLTLTATSQSKDCLTLFRWFESGFHQVGDKTPGKITEVSVLNLEQCYNPIIFVSMLHYPRGGPQTSLNIYRVSKHEGLKLDQTVYSNFDKIRPYSFDCNSYNFLLCKKHQNTTSCSIYRSSIESFELLEVRTISSLSTDWKIASTPGFGVVCDPRNSSNALVFTDSNLVHAIALKISNDDENRIECSEIIWSTEKQQIHMLLISKNQNKISFRIGTLKRIDGNVGQIEVTASDPLESITKKIREIIYFRKSLLDRIPFSDRMGNIENIHLNKTSIDHGTISVMNIKNPSLSLPFRIRKRIEKLKIQINTSKISNVASRKQIFVKNLHLNNLQYNTSLCSDSKRKLSIDSIVNDTSEKLILNDTTVKAQQQQQSTDDDDKDLKMKIFRGVTASSLNIHTINSINFTQLYEIAFQRIRDNSVRGTLTFSKVYHRLTPSIRCEKMQIEILNQRSVSDFFTLDSDQEINSNLYISKFLVTDINVGSLNGNDIKQIALVRENNTIKSPVQVGNLTVLKDFVLTADDEFNFANHIRSTIQLSDFSQIYQGNVRIKGQLIVNDLLTDQDMPNTNLMKLDLINEPLDIGNLQKLFWMRNSSQTFHVPVRFALPVNLDSITTTALNNELMTNYVHVQTGIWKLPSMLRIKSLQIRGNLTTDLDFPAKSNSPMRVEQLGVNLIQRRFGRPVKIFGKKVFQNRLRVRNLFVKNIHSIPTNNLVDRDQSNTKTIVFTGPKSLKKLTVTKRFELSERIDVEVFNGKKLTDFFDAAVKVQSHGQKSSPNKAKQLRFINPVTVNNVIANFINDYPIVTDYLQRLGNSNSSGKSKVITIKGNVSLNKNLQVETLNDIVWDEYYDLLALQNSGQRVFVGGSKEFLDSVTVNYAMNTATMNDISVKKLLKSTLRQSGSQTIHSNWKFQSFHASSFTAKSKINGVRFKDLVCSISDIRISSDIQITSARLKGNFYGRIENDSFLHDPLNSLKELNHSNWAEIRVTNNVTWPSFDNNPKRKFEHIRDNAVRKDAEQQLITGRVRFIAVPRFHDVRATSNLAGVDFNHLMKDSVVRDNKSNKTIHVVGSKLFENQLIFQESVRINNQLNAEILNDIDVISLNRSLYRREPNELHTFYGQKMFQNKPIFGNLHVKGTINSVKLEYLIFANRNGSVPAKLRFVESNLFSNSLETMRVNEVNLNSFLQGRTRLSGESQTLQGLYSFVQLRVRKAVLSTINDLNIERVLLKNFKHHQIVIGPKTFTNPLRIIGPSSILNVNGVELIGKYSSSVLLNQDHAFDEVKITGSGQTSFHQGIRELNGISKLSSIIHENMQKLQKNLDLSRQGDDPEFAVNVYRPLYLERDQNVQLNLKGRMSNYWNITSIRICNDDCANSCDVNSLDLGITDNGKKITFQLEPKINTYSIPNRNLKVTMSNDCTMEHSQLNIEVNRVLHELKFAVTIQNVWSFYTNHPNTDYLLIEFRHSDRTKTAGLIRVENEKSNVTLIQEIPGSLRGNDQNHVESQLIQLRTSSRPVFLFPTQRLNILEFNEPIQRFIEITSHDLIWNRVALVQVEGANYGFHLVAGIHGQRTISIFNGNASNAFQKLQIPYSIQDITAHGDHKSDRQVLIVTTSFNHFYVFKYQSDVEGWTFETFGISENLKLITHVEKLNAIGVVLPEVNIDSRLETALSALLRFHMQRGIR